MKTKPKANLPLIVVVPESARPEELASLQAAGYVVIRTDFPDKVTVFEPSLNDTPNNDILLAAMYALGKVYASSSRQDFSNDLIQRVQKRSEK